MGENLEAVGREMSRCARHEHQRVSTNWKEEKKDIEKQENVPQTRRRECVKERVVNKQKFVEV